MQFSVVEEIEMLSPIPLVLSSSDSMVAEFFNFDLKVVRIRGNGNITSPVDFMLNIDNIV